MKPLSDVREAIATIDDFRGRADEFELCLAESLHDPIGLNVALVTDRILAKGWEPASVERMNGWRIYRYKESS